MKTLLQMSVRTSQSEAAKIPVWESLVKEGQMLPNSVTEDIQGFSLMPYYSVKQLRRINARMKYKNRSLSRTAKREWRLAQRW